MADRRPPAFLLLGIAVVAVLAMAHSGEVRARASTALGRGMPAREAELARGFVLGEDEGIDPATVEDFRRSGLSHLLAVSGQNVALLAVLATPLLAALGIPLRTRLLWILALIAVYVPLAGAGPAIQRAAVMGCLNLLAMMVGRRSSRFYALAFAAAVTLAIEPHIAADVGWQLSFAAVLGILLLGPLLRRSLARFLAAGALGRALAETAAMTIAATVATAPLIAFHFGELSTTTLFANLLAAPAVGPAMWLGMVAAAGGQVPGFPVEAINWVDALLLAYVAQVAAWCGRPSWAFIHVRPNLAGVFGTYVALAICTVGILRLRRRRRISALRRRKSAGGQKTPPYAPFPSRRRRLVLAAAVLLVALAGVRAVRSPVGGAAQGPSVGLRVSVLDVGQGDAILLQPAQAPAVLVDGGPPGDALPAKLADAGVERLGVVIVTHDQSDHAGGIREALGSLPVGRLAFGVLRRRTLADVREAGVAAYRVARGDEVRSGALRLEVLWPPAEVLRGPSAEADPNSRALVLLARWGRFTMLLSADAEAETTPIDPGPLDALKIAHHGSDDAGLADLLERTEPRIAIVSVGEDNPYGHPTAGTLATLASHGVRVLRTDRDGTVSLDVVGASMRVTADG